MPITQLEQLNLYSRPSNEFLATIPIKKRHFLFTRQTSPQGLPNLNDHNVSEKKNELLELESSCANDESKFKGTCLMEDSGLCGNNPETTVISEPQDNTEGLANHVAHSEFSAVVVDHMHEWKSVVDDHMKSALSETTSRNTTYGYKSANPDMDERKHENLKPGCILQINYDAGKPASKGTSKESLKESRDLNIDLEHDTSFTVDKERSNVQLGAMSKDGNCGVQEIVLKNNCTIPSSSNTQVFELQGKFSADDISMKQEVHSDKVKEDSGHISMNRINWDLNTPMDAWEGSMESSLLSNGTVENEHHEGVKFDTFELGFKQILTDEPDGTDKKNPLLLQNTVNTNSEACLELQLKPLSNSCTLRKLNVDNSEMSFLSLGTNPMPCASEPQLLTETVVKSEQVKKLVEVQMQNLKTPDLNQVKIEPTEALAISKTAIFDDSNLVSSKLTPKHEPLDDIREANQISCKTNDKISNLTPQPCTTRNCINSSIHELSSNTSGTVKNGQLSVEQALVDANSSDVIPKSLIPDKEDTQSTSEACANSKLPSTEALQSLPSTLNAQHSSNSTLTDDLYKKMGEDSKVDESDDVDYKAGTDELCDNTTCNSGSSQVNTGFEQFGNYNEDNMTAEVSCEATKLLSKTSNSVSSTDCPKESNSVDTSKCETSVSSIGKTRKLINRPVNDISNEGKGMDRNLRTNYSSSRAISADNQIDQQITKDIVSDKEVTLKDCNGRADQRIIYLNTASGKRNYTSERPLFSSETRRPTGESFRTRAFYDKSRKVEHERRYEHQMQNSRFDAPHYKARAEQMNTANFSKQSRKQDFDDGRQNVTRFPYQFQRQSPISHPRSVRDISPKDRITGREAHDFAGLSPEENEYERTRERTSFSPPLRRSRPQHFAPRRTITHWSPPRRSSTEYNEHRSRSPQPVRIPYYQQERVGNRRMNVSPPREDNYPRSSRVSNKNIRNFNREINEEDNEEYFDQICEYDDDDKFIDDRRYNDDQKFINDRRCDERHSGPIRENNQYHDEDGANPRDFDSRFRYRLGNSSGRFRGYVDDQEDGYRIREEQEWRDSRTGFNDTKIKRRRF